MGFQKAEAKKQSTHSCLESIWFGSDGNRALPLFLHGYRVLASNLNTSDLWLGCHEINRTFSTYFILPCQLIFFFFFFASQPLWGLIVCISLIVVNSSKVGLLSLPLDSAFLRQSPCVFSGWKVPDDGNLCPLYYYRNFSKGANDSCSLFSSESRHDFHWESCISSFHK